jgi:hypothetical protein
MQKIFDTRYCNKRLGIVNRKAQENLCFVILFCYQQNNHFRGLDGFSKGILFVIRIL